MGRRKTYRSELRACAVERHGFVTRADTVRLGIPGTVVDGLVAGGHLVGVGEDLFRWDGVPHTRRNTLAEAVLRAGPDACLSHDAVLALHDLIDHDPAPVRVSTPHEGSQRWPDIEIVRRELPADEVTTYRGIRSTTVTRALLDCRALLALPILTAAADAAVVARLLLRRERHAVLEALQA